LRRWCWLWFWLQALFALRTALGSGLALWFWLRALFASRTALGCGLALLGLWRFACFNFSGHYCHNMQMINFFFQDFLFKCATQMRGLVDRALNL
jgi:hypothetical protein